MTKTLQEQLNTIQLLEELSIRRESSEATPFLEVVGLDASLGILEVARSAMQTAVKEKNLHILGCIITGAAEPSLQTSGAVGVISTLVLEYIPAKEFFDAAAARILPGAYLMITNMHAALGVISQAGGGRESWIRCGELVGEDGGYSVLQRAVDQQLGEESGARAKKWVGIKGWFGICFSKI
ncbi:hypothetical protein N7523_005003 [Penicillium sp. IBT 18751x]|nr:hypothetical protein N7523_005003 [Penicillium sp. IBT 18751x]